MNCPSELSSWAAFPADAFERSTQNPSVFAFTQSSSDDSRRIEELLGVDVRLLNVECLGIRNSNQFFERVSRAISFPSYFGHNWDAFNECIHDLEWIRADYVLVLWSSYSRLVEEAPGVAAKLELVLCSFPHTDASPPTKRVVHLLDCST